MSVMADGGLRESQNHTDVVDGDYLLDVLCQLAVDQRELTDKISTVR